MPNGWKQDGEKLALPTPGYYSKVHYQSTWRYHNTTLSVYGLWCWP